MPENRPSVLSKESAKEYGRKEAGVAWRKISESLQGMTQVSAFEFLDQARTLQDNQPALSGGDRKKINGAFKALRTKAPEFIREELKESLITQINSHRGKGFRQKDLQLAKVLGLDSDIDVSKAIGPESKKARHFIEGSLAVTSMGILGLGAANGWRLHRGNQRLPEDPVPAPAPSPSPEPVRTPEKKEASPSRSELLGFRVNSVEAIEALPPSVGIIRIDGDSNLIYPDGRFHFNPDHHTEEMLDAADKKGLKVVFAYKVSWFPGAEHGVLKNGDLQKSSQILGNHMRAVLKHPSVKYFEVGNEIDQNNISDPNHFWAGNMKDYAKLFKLAVDNLKPINQDRTSPTELIISSFADPMGKFNLHARKDLQDLARALIENGVNPASYPIAAHAYHKEILEWALNNLQEITGANRVIVTEFNVGNINPQRAPNQELAEMVTMMEQRKVLALAHEFKPESKNENQYALSLTDMRFKVILDSIGKEILMKTNKPS